MTTNDAPREEAMTDTHDASWQPIVQPTDEQVDPQEQYLQEQEAAAAAPVNPVPDTRRQRPRSTLPVISAADALDRIAEMLAGEDLEGAPALSAIASIVRDTGRQPAEVAARLAQPSRADRLRDIVDQHAVGDELLARYLGTPPPRFVLVERNARGGESFLTLHDTPDDAAGYHATQEDAGWVIEKLVDLDTGAEMAAETRTSVTWSSS